MNEREHFLTVLSEECAEVAQRACKAIRFGLEEIQPGQEENNKRRLERELADLMATAELLDLNIRDTDKDAKKEKLKKYMKYSREIGTLEGLDHAPSTKATFEQIAAEIHKDGQCYCSQAKLCFEFFNGESPLCAFHQAIKILEKHFSIHK